MFDVDQQRVLAYLEHQFPQDYPQEKKVVVVRKPSAEEQEKKEKDSIMEQSKKALQMATDYQDSIEQAKKDKIEKEKLSMMGMAGEEVTVEL